MKCPACFNALTPLQVGRIKVDVCEGACGGIWFDAFELQQVDDEDEEAGEALLQIRRDASLQVDMARKRACPRCDGVKLKRRYFSARRQVEIDECPGCGGVWLDAGELEKIREETGDTRFIERVQSGRQPLTMSVIRFMYRARLEETGDDL